MSVLLYATRGDINYPEKNLLILLAELNLMTKTNILYTFMIINYVLLFVKEWQWYSLHESKSQ